jgi:hypothetical protein
MSIGVRRHQDKLDVAIDTRNRAREEQATSLQRRLDEIAAAPDAAEHYQLLMRRTVKQSEGSGLGLGRIRAEADMSLSCRVLADIVHVYARATYPAPPAP